jgi:hypothetical protein
VFGMCTASYPPIAPYPYLCDNTVGKVAARCFRQKLRQHEPQADPERERNQQRNQTAPDRPVTAEPLRGAKRQAYAVLGPLGGKHVSRR